VAILTNPTGVATGQTTADGTVTTDTGSGDVYTVVTQSSRAPTAAQVKAGLDGFGSPADYAQNSLLFGLPGVVAFSAVGLAPATTYFFHFMQEILNGSQSAVVTSSAFTTDAPPMSLRRRDRSRTVIVRGAL